MGFVKFVGVFLAFWTVVFVVSVAAVSGPGWFGLLVAGGVLWLFGVKPALEKQERKRERGRWVQ